MVRRSRVPVRFMRSMKCRKKYEFVELEKFGQPPCDRQMADVHRVEASAEYRNSFQLKATASRAIDRSSISLSKTDVRATNLSTPLPVAEEIAKNSRSSFSAIALSSSNLSGSSIASTLVATTI